MRSLLLVMTASTAVAWSGCHKSGPGAPKLLGEHFQFCSDSCHAEAPNVFTPTGDGMNDRFYISQNWITDLHLAIWNSVHQVVLESSDRYVQWDGHDPHSSVSGPTMGFYTYTLSVTGTNGAHFTQDRTLWVITDLNTICFLPEVAPVFGDQFDPRLCGIIYASNDVVCLYE